MKTDEIKGELSGLQQLLGQLEQQLTAESQRKVLNQALLILERLNPVRKSPQSHEIEVAYWPSGHWIDDVKDAPLMDRVHAFGAEPHKCLLVEEGADIDAAVAAAIAGGHHGS